MKKMVITKDKNDIMYHVSEDDPRLLSGDLFIIDGNKGHTEEGKNRIGKSASKRQNGKNNCNYGKVWIYNMSSKKSISIPKDSLEQYLKKGWERGRKIKW